MRGFKIKTNLYKGPAPNEAASFQNPSSFHTNAVFVARCIRWSIKRPRPPCSNTIVCFFLSSSLVKCQIE